MAKVTLDGKEYETEDMSDNAKGQLASLQFIEVHVQKLRNEIAVCDTARMAYTRALKEELEPETKKSKK